MPIVKFLSLFFLLLCNVNGIGQTRLSEINFDKIKYKKVREYLETQQSHNVKSMLDIKPSMRSNSNNKGYRVDERVYVFKDSLKKVWKHYNSTSPGDSWNGTRFKFGLLFSKKENKVIYHGEDISSIESGQVVYLNLKLLRGISNLATVFQFISIDGDKKIIEFSYVDGNITKGKQQLQFRQTSKGYTEILHTTYYKSKSVLRDRLYPYFHTRLINEFHRNMKRLYKSRTSVPVFAEHEVSSSILVSSEETEPLKEVGDL